MLNINRPVQTRRGLKARIICTDCKGVATHPIVALVTLTSGVEEPYIYTTEGHLHSFASLSPLDLVNAPLVQEMWMALSTDGKATHWANQCTMSLGTHYTKVKVRVEVIE